MPIRVKVLGISGDRVTLGVEGEFRGNKIDFHQSTFSLEPGAQLNLGLNVHIEGIGDHPSETREVEITPDGPYPPADLPLLYKVTPT